MHVLQSAELLQIWEQGASATAVQRGLLLLTAVYPDVPPESLVRLSLGQRDRRLLLLRQALFGPRLESVAHCPNCHERLEFQVNINDILTNGDETAAEAAQTFQAGRYEVQFRLPNSLDMATIPDGATVSEAQNHLLARCLLAVSHDGQAVATAETPEDVVQQTMIAMSTQDKQADTRLALECPACGHAWSAPLAIVSFLWTEIEQWAVRVLQEVHILASAYGWSEQAILQMSPWRRQLYLEMVLA